MRKNIKWPCLIYCETVLPNKRRIVLDKIIEGLGLKEEEIKKEILKALSSKHKNKYLFYGCEIKYCSPVGFSSWIINPNNPNIIERMTVKK